MMRSLMRVSIFPLFLLLLHCKDDLPVTDQPAPKTPQTRVMLIRDQINNREVLVLGEPRLDVYTAFYAPSGVDFAPVQDSLPVVLRDSEGTLYDIWGEAVSGPGVGLEPANAMMAYWFSWGAMYPGCDLYQHDAITAPPSLPGDNDWLIPFSRLSQGALPGAIPSIDEPVYLERETDFMAYLTDETPCLVLKTGGKVYVYPHPVLEWHEVVNDKQNGLPFSVFYCPLTGSGNAWVRELNGQELQFEVSGLLFNSNLIALERSTGSYWSQMLYKGVFGLQAGKQAASLHVLEMPLGTARRLFKQFRLLSDQTKHSRDYGNFPSGDYYTNNDLIFYTIHFDDPRVPRKEKTLGIVVNGVAKVYRRAAFQ